MTPSSNWEQWDGQGYLSTKLLPVIYYYPGKVDIENDAVLDNLVDEIHIDGVAPDKRGARRLLESAVVVHGQIVDIDGELHYYSGSSYDAASDSYGLSSEATWVELDEYED